MSPLQIFMGLLTQQPTQPYILDQFPTPTWYGYAASPALVAEGGQYGQFSFTFTNLTSLPVDDVVGFFLYSTYSGQPQLIAVSPFVVSPQICGVGNTTINISYLVPSLPQGGN